MPARPVEAREGPYQELVREGSGRLLGVEEVIGLEVHVVNLTSLAGPVHTAVRLRGEMAGHDDAVALAALSLFADTHHEETVSGMGLIVVPYAPVEIRPDRAAEEVLVLAIAD